jgi:hypothetical protein
MVERGELRIESCGDFLDEGLKIFGAFMLERGDLRVESCVGFLRWGLAVGVSGL